MRRKRLVFLPFAVPLLLVGYLYVSTGLAAASAIGGAILVGGFILVAVAMT